MAKRIPTREVCRRTGLSPRHWQLRVAAGEVPGVIRYGRGKRSVYLWDEAVFMAWWEQQGQAVTSTVAPAANVKPSEPPSPRTARRLLAKELRANWKS